MAVQATDYYVAGINDDWSANNENYKMSGSGPYSVTKQLSSGSYQFKITNGSWGNGGYGNFDQGASNVTLSNNGGNIAFTLSTTSDVTFYFNASTEKAYVQAVAAVVPSYTFPAGTTIYYDFTAYGSGVNLYNSVWNNEWKSDVSSIISCPLTSDWEVTTNTVLFKSAPPSNTWTTKTCSTLPVDGQNMLVGDANGIDCHWDTYVPAPPTIKMHGNFLGSWNTTDPFVIAAGNATASLSLTIPAKGTKEFGMRIGSDDNWTSNGASITRASASAAIVSGSANCTLNADIPGAYTFTWTYATNTLSVTYPDLPAQFVAFDGLSSEILKGTNVTFAATSTGITNPVYSFYVKPAGGEYGSAVTSYTFDAEGAFTVKVSAEGDNTAAPVVEEANVVVYDTYTFTAGTRIYVDFTAMTEGAKNVNYPFGHVATSDPLDYDENGAGTFKTIRFSENVTWSTMSDFIKTAKAGWAGQKFTIPAEGQNKIIVAADGASYTWGTYTPATVQVKFFAPRDESSDWSHVYAHSWDAAGDITAWPGVEITDTKANLWYAYNVQVGANVLFHNGNGMQTANIVNIQAAACYEPTAIDYESTPKIVTVTTNTGCEIAYYIAGSKELVGGTEDWQVNLPLDAENKIVFQDVEPGTYAFKINNGTWAWALGGYSNLSDEEGCGTIAVEVGTGDIGFAIATKQDVTITYNPVTQKICLGAETVKAAATITAANMTIEAGEVKAIAYSTNNTEATGATFTILSGGDYISLNNGVITGIKAGEAAIRITVAETANYTEATKDITVTVTTPADPGLDPITPIGGKFIINANGDTAVFSRGNLQYQQSTDTWRCAPNQYEWKGITNLQMGNAEFEGWVDLFCWSIGAENNYGATSAYLTTDYYNKAFVDWGGLFTGDWSTLSINEWYYVLYNRPNANNLWGMAMIDDNLGMILLPDQWTAPSGVTFVPGTIPTTNMWYDDDCLDPTHADEDHWRLNPDNLPANKFTVADWEILEAAGAVFFPYAGRRSGGYGNHTNRLDQTVGYEYAYSYYENYYGAYWTSTVAKPAEGKSYWLPMICGGCDANHENWGRGSHGWWENGRYGHSVRLVKRIPRQEVVIRDNLNNGKWGTLCPKQNVEFVNGATFYQISYLEEQGGMPYNMIFDEISGTTLTAGNPYFFIAEGEEIRGSVSGAKLTEAGSGVNGFYGYIGTDPMALSWQADYEPGANNTYVIYNNKVTRINGPTDLRSERCYININATEPTRAASAPVPARRRITMNVQNTTVATDLEQIIDADAGVVKVLRNGQLLILRGDKQYNAQGQIVK